MKILRLYARVLALLGPEARLGWILAGANLALACSQFIEPMLFGRIVDTLANAQGGSRQVSWPDLLPLVAAWVAFGLFMAFFNRARHEDRRASQQSDTKTAAEAPAVTEPAAAPDDKSPGHADPKAAASDEELQANVEKVLTGSKLTKEEEIDVNAQNRTVTLSGGVSAPLVSQVAQALAETVPGVERVNNRLKVVEGHGGPPPPGWPDLSGIPFLHPPVPGSAGAKALAELLDQGQRALKNDQPEEALGVFIAALSLDPKNRTARRGLEQASRSMKHRGPEMPAPPAAPTPPSN